MNEPQVCAIPAPLKGEALSHYLDRVQGLRRQPSGGDVMLHEAATHYAAVMQFRRRMLHLDTVGSVRTAARLLKRFTLRQRRR
jgi:hypothetical protein